MDTMSSGEPRPRAYHAAGGVGDRLFVWGGHRIETTTLETFNVSSLTWQQPQQFKNALPNDWCNPAVAGEGENFYSFGGTTSSGYINTLYVINPLTLLCRELPPSGLFRRAPQKQEGSRCVCCDNKLVVYGGCTSKSDRNGDLHVFDLDRRVWAEQKMRGEKPPTLSNHTFTRIDHHKAVVFGGFTDTGNSSSRINDTYVLNMETWHWTKLPCETKPPAREHHAACCIAGPLTGQEHPLLLVVEGRGNVMTTLGDVWLLDVDKGVWSEVILPVAITPRYGHSAVVFGSGPSFRVVVIFEGWNVSYCDITETTLLLLELRGGSWQVTRVVKPDELARRDESLREQMGKLELSPLEGVAGGVEER